MLYTGSCGACGDCSHTASAGLDKRTLCWPLHKRTYWSAFPEHRSRRLLSLLLVSHKMVSACPALPPFSCRICVVADFVCCCCPAQDGVRWDPRKWAYLNRGDQFAWQDCGETCWNDLSSRYNVQGGPINVWVAGSFEGAFKCTPLAILCQLSANGLTTSNPGANDQFRPGGEDSPTQVRTEQLCHWLVSDCKQSCNVYTPPFCMLAGSSFMPRSTAQHRQQAQPAGKKLSMWLRYD